MALLALVAFLAPLLSAGALRAAVAYQRDAHGNLFAPGTGTVQVLKIRQSFPDPECPNITVTLALSVPTGTGSEAVDRVLAADLQRAAREGLGKVLFDSAEGCSYTSVTESQLTLVFELNSPRPGILSVIFTSYYYMAGMVHGNYSHRAMTFDLGSGRELALEDLVLDPPGVAAALRRLWPEMAKMWCGYNDETSLPSFYGLNQMGANLCSNPERTPLPERLGRRATLADLGNAHLTAEGLALTLDPYDGWSYGHGASTMVIDKATLIRAGFDPSLWGRAR
jgi:hypothetical protein